ncbi:MAG: radical SAM protein [Proteobacteria bacterium]|nr:radical SAM protein [Pseudomonadota bacterium]
MSSSTLENRLATAISEGRISGRLWLYSNYHCNLACRYCLTESSPSSPARNLDSEQMIKYAIQGKALGFTGIGITGGEPFLRSDIINIISEITKVLPVTVLTNGTLFNKRRLLEFEHLKESDLRIQISLDSANPIQNDEMRGPTNFAKVIEAVPKLVDMGFHVRIASTVSSQDPEEKRALQDLVATLGIKPKDHIIRHIVSRGRAVLEKMGVFAPLEKLSPELTITAHGAFWSPFAPTYKNGRLQKDLLITTKTQPLSHPTIELLNFIQSVPVAEEIEGFV